MSGGAAINLRSRARASNFMSAHVFTNLTIRRNPFPERSSRSS